MILSKYILTLLTGSVNAAVLNNIRSSLERRATQSCHATCHGAFASYSVQIGVTYDPSTCDNTYNTLEWTAAGPDDISNWQCVATDDGNTQLWFNSASGEGSLISYGLEASYPDVNSFNCPDC